MCGINCKEKTIEDILAELRALPMQGENVSYLPRGNSQIPYVSWKIVAEALSYVCCRWQWTILEEKMDEGGWMVRGRLTLTDAYGQFVSRDESGYQTVWDAFNSTSRDVKTMLANENITPSIVVQYPIPSPFEVAGRSAFKRAASLFGVIPE